MTTTNTSKIVRRLPDVPASVWCEVTGSALIHKEQDILFRYRRSCPNCDSSRFRTTDDKVASEKSLASTSLSRHSRRAISRTSPLHYFPTRVIASCLPKRSKIFSRQSRIDEFNRSPTGYRHTTMLPPLTLRCCCNGTLPLARGDACMHVRMRPRTENLLVLPTLKKQHVECIECSLKCRMEPTI